MKKLYHINVADNEVVKAADIQKGNKSTIDNVVTALQSITEPNQDFIVCDEDVIQPNTASNDMSFNLAPLFGISLKDEDVNAVLSTSKTVAVATLETGWAVDRIDTIEIEGKYVGSDNQARAFIDFSNNSKTVQFFDTQNDLNFIIHIKSNPNDGVPYATAPGKTKGFIKLAEIFVPANAISIADCEIYSVSADYKDMPNNYWTTDKTATYNLKNISDLKKAYRSEHKSDGSHGDRVIKASNIDYGTGTTQVNGTKEPVGNPLRLYDQNYESNTSIYAFLSSVAKLIGTRTSSLSEDGVEYSGTAATANESKSVSNVSIADLEYDGIKLGSNDIDYLIQSKNSLFWNALKSTESLITYYACSSSVHSSKGFLIFYNIDDGYAEVHLSEYQHFIAFSGDVKWTELNYGGGSSNPVGTVLSYTGTTAPAGFLLCDGSEYNQADYPDLYNLVKDIPECKSKVSGKFKVYDLRESTIVGAGTNTTKTIAEHDTYTVGQFKDDQLQGHKHDDEGHTHSSAGGAYKTGSGSYYNLATAGYNTGTGYAKLGGPTQYSDDSVDYGSPRTGTTTHGKQTGLNFIIKATQTKDDLETIIDDSKTDVGHAYSGAKVNTLIHNSGKTYLVTPTNSAYNSILTIPDNVPLVEGNVIKLFINNDCKSTSTGTSISSFDLYMSANNFTRMNIFVYKNGQKQTITVKKIDNYAMCAQKGVTLELIYDGENWVIMGNPIVLSHYGSDNSYSVYADGEIEQWGDNTVTDLTLPISYTSLESYQVISSPIVYRTAARYDSEYYRKSTSNTLIKANTLLTSWRTKGY